MFRKTTILLVFLAIAANYTAFSQSVAIDAALSNAVQEIAKSVPQGTKIAVLNMSSDYGSLSDYIIDELTVNLVNAKSFQVVPRSTVELELANREFDFQMTGNVSDDSQKRLGQFLGAGTIISGSITRDSSNTYRLVVNAIDLESFTYQTSYRTSIQNNKKMKELVTASGGGVFDADFDYTTGQRIGMGALNIFGGAGSLMNGHKIGGLTTGLEAAGLLAILSGLIFVDVPDEHKSDKAAYDSAVQLRNTLIGGGSVLIGAGVVFGFIVPFFHHKPGAQVAVSPLDRLQLNMVSLDNKNTGVQIVYGFNF